MRLITTTSIKKLHLRKHFIIVTVVIIVDGDTVDPLLLHQARVLQRLDDDGPDPLGDLVHRPLGVQLLLPVPCSPLPLAAGGKGIVAFTKRIGCPTQEFRRFG